MTVYIKSETERKREIKLIIRRLMEMGDWQDAACVMYEWFNNEAYERLIDARICPWCAHDLPWEMGMGIVDCRHCNLTQVLV